jgi:hypothetical protein
VTQYARAADTSLLNVTFTSSKSDTNLDFAKWVVRHYQMKIIQESTSSVWQLLIVLGLTGAVYVSNDTGDFDLSEHYVVTPTYLDTTFLKVRYDLDIKTASLCQKQDCFWVKNVWTMVDPQGKKVN